MSGSFDRVRVLIVEDNPHMSKILRVTLQGFGVRVIEECRDAETAIERQGPADDDPAAWPYDGDWLTDVRDQPQHPARRALDDLLRQLAQDLQHDPSTMQRAEQLKARLLLHPGVADGMLSLWGRCSARSSTRWATRSSMSGRSPARVRR